MKLTGVSGRLVYDADCAFCTRFAAWSGAAVPWQDLDLERVGATVDQVTTAAGWMVDGRIVTWGSEAIAAAMIQRGGPARALGLVLRAPVIRTAAEVVYKLVARNRHLMPGGTAACRVESSAPTRATMVLAMSAILVIGLASLSASNHRHEPYPSLTMPGFGRVHEAAGNVEATEATYTLMKADGSTRLVASRQVLGEHSGYVAAQRTMDEPRTATDPAVARWIRSNLGPAAHGATALRVDWHHVTYDTNTGHRADLGVLRSVTIDLSTGVS